MWKVPEVVGVSGATVQDLFLVPRRFLGVSGQVPWRLGGPLESPAVPWSFWQLPDPPPAVPAGLPSCSSDFVINSGGGFGDQKLSFLFFQLPEHRDIVLTTFGALPVKVAEKLLLLRLHFPCAFRLVTM